MIIVGNYYPVGTLPYFDDKFKQEIESKSKEELGSKYSVSANYVKKPKFGGVELIISKIGYNKYITNVFIESVYK